MKKIYILILTICLSSISCEYPVTSPQVIGTTFNESGNTDVVAGPDNIISIWESYIDAHNSRDTESVRALNADDFTAFGPAGEVVEGSDAHIEFLTNWFKENNPIWTIEWAISNTAELSEGDIGDFVTAGHELKLNVDGIEITAYQIIDASIVDGKIQSFNVYQQDRGQPSNE